MTKPLPGDVAPGKKRRVRAPPKGARHDDRLTVPNDPVDLNAANGKPTNYEFDKTTELVQRLCMLGLTNREIAHTLGIAVETYERWLATYQDLRDAVFEGREGADAVVARALFRRAIGYEHDEDDIRTVAVGNNEGSEIVITKTVKRYPPDTGAATAWLAIRQRERWRGIKATGAEEGGDVPPTERAAQVRAAVAAAMAEVPPANEGGE
jgi:hypothetical protein